ncbi:Guanine nucleotide-binding protein 3 [Phytophthora cinnamomi]|uniref:Guanine nucleotide-binding protein 3 n=1 Tax=Phytophthora cinnamomi TaxID=4785 RepID=UPI00355AAE2D|nr:Guanine nucleotide-binding protein 3 [Phytophthora cinnamomi]
MEEPVPADDDGQQQSEADVAGSEDTGSKAALSSPETDNDGFDADTFASMMKQELIAYSMSWDPLMKVLQALGASLAKQQRAQQSNDAAMKKMENQVAALRDDLTRAEDEKKDAAAAMEVMQNQVGEMQNQLEEIQGLAPHDGQEEQQQGTADNPGNSTVEASGGESEVSPSVKSPRSPRASSIGRQPFVTAKELADAKKELRKELKNALAQAFGHDGVDEGDDEEHSQEGSGAETDGEPNAAGDSTDGSPRSSRSRGGAGKLQLPGAPFASAAELQQEVAKLQGIQDALNAKMSEHDQLLEALNDQMGKLNEPSSGLEAENATAGYSDGNGAQKTENSGQQDDFAATTNEILNELKELKAVQDEYDLKLRDHDEAVEKHTADIKALADSLDDISVQQQTVASMYSSGGSASGGAEDGCGKDTASTDDPGKSGKNEKQAGRVVEATSQPHLDLSLVFTKLADLRRSTDASLNSLQQSIKGVSGTTQSQQEQLDALRNNVVFNEHLQAHLVEARLAMQKELLARNQTFQDRTKPQLVEWRKALELTEDKLLQGNSDDETLHALQQMQRCYHRTVLSIAPLVNSPLSIAETLQTLSDEVKQLQNAVRLGVVPLRVTDYSNVNENSEGEPNKEDREEEYTRKLRYLDEEIDATLQVNITTEKKNDPLIKGLDAMREKLELLWSMWHRNYNSDRSQPSDVVAVSSGSSTNSSSADNHAAHNERRHSFQRNPESLREMELRLSGAVRRLAMVEEDIERLNSLTAHLNAADRGPGNAGSDGSMPIVSRRAPSTNNLRTELVMEEIEKLRKEVYAEIAKLSTQSLGDANGGSNSNSNSTTSLVSMDRRSMVEAAAKQGDVLTDLYSQMTGRELDTRLYNSAEGQKQFYDNFIKEVTKKVSGIINADKGGPRGPGIGGAANANVNYRLLLDNFAQKVDDRLEDAREFTTEELARLRRELMEQLKIRFEVALRDIRGELMLLQPTDGDSTAMGTKPVMCVACSRPVPVSTVIREAGSLPADIVNPEPVNPALPAEFDYDRPDDEFVFRAGFKMPANDRKILTLPFLTTAMRNKMVLNKPEGKRKRPPRQSHLNRVDNVVREAMELDRASRGRAYDAQ